MNVKYYSFLRLTIVGIKFLIASIIAYLLAKKYVSIDLLSVCFITALCLQPNLYRSIKTILSHFTATTIATIITSILMLFAIQMIPLEFRIITVMPLSIAAMIIFIIKFDMLESGPIALFTVAYLTTMPAALNKSYWQIIHIRYLTIIIGVFVAFFVNYIFSFLKYKSRFYINIKKMFKMTKNLLMEFEEIITELQWSDLPAEKVQYFKTKSDIIFSFINDLNKEFSELKKETIFRKNIHYLDEKTFNFYSNLILRNHNILHYFWDILNTLAFYQIPEQQKKITDLYSKISLDYRKIAYKIIDPNNDLTFRENNNNSHSNEFLKKNKDLIYNIDNDLDNINLLNIFISLRQIDFNINILKNLFEK